MIALVTFLFHILTKEILKNLCYRMVGLKIIKQ